VNTIPASATDDAERQAKRDRRIRLATRIAVFVILTNTPRPRSPAVLHVGPFWLAVMVARSAGKRPVQFMAAPPALP
jgi:hypothetical protein